MMFADRIDAATRLGKALQAWRGRNPLVLAIDAYIEEEKRLQLDVLKDRRARYTPGRGAIDAAGRVAIVVDDGLATGADEVVCLYAPDDFYAVGQFYRTFGQVEDEEAIRLLAGAAATRPPP